MNKQMLSLNRLEGKHLRVLDALHYHNFKVFHETLKFHFENWVREFYEIYVMFFFG